MTFSLCCQYLKNLSALRVLFCFQNVFIAILIETFADMRAEVFVNLVSGPQTTTEVRQGNGATVILVPVICALSSACVPLFLFGLVQLSLLFAADEKCLPAMCSISLEFLCQG